MKSKIFIILTIIVGAFSFSSCLNDSTHDNWGPLVAGKMYATVENPHLQALALKPTTDTIEYSFMINIATDKLPTSDITITMKVDPSAVIAYDSLTGKDYKVFPNIKILNPTIVIPKGTRNALVHCQVWGADKLNACDNFISPVSIDAVSGNIPIAANMKTCLMSLPISNPYEGKYHSTGTFVHPTAGTRIIDEIKDLTTVNCNTVHTTVGDLGGYDAYFQVNADNSVTVWGGLSASQLLIQSGVNTYNPATKTFVINYYYVGSSGHRVISETLVKL